MNLLSKLAIVIILSASSMLAQAETITITFDDVAGNLTGSLINDGYHGFDWNFGAIEPAANGEPFATSGYANGLISGDYVGFLPSGPSSMPKSVLSPMTSV